MSLVPQKLREIPSPPKSLAVRGDAALLRSTAPAVAVVGSRRPTPDAEALTWKLAGAIARAGGIVVSGLAMGIDSVANRGAIAAGGKTICVMPAGVEDRELTPRRNLPLAEEILSAGGALVCETPVPPKLQPYHFVLRDRIQSGLADCVIVCSSELTGGAMHTARFALDQGRPVFVPNERGRVVGEGAVALTESPISELRELAPAFKSRKKARSEEELAREERPAGTVLDMSGEPSEWIAQLTAQR